MEKNDRRHPQKRLRPIAAGELPASGAVFAAAVFGYAAEGCRPGGGCDQDDTGKDLTVREQLISLVVPVFNEEATDAPGSAA